MKKILILIIFNSGFLFAQPWDDFRLGTDTLKSNNTTEAKDHFSKAAREWEAQVSDAQGKFNAGTSWALAGNYREAVINLRGFLRDNPFSWEAKENLEKARKDGGLVDPGWDLVFKTWILYILVILASAMTSFFCFRWGFLILRGKKNLRNELFLVFVAGAILGLGVFTLAAWVPEIRVLGSSVSPRKGDGEFYESLGEPWKPGQELFLLEKRQGWALVKAGTREGWVPEDLLVSY